VNKASAYSSSRTRSVLRGALVGWLLGWLLGWPWHALAQGFVDPGQTFEPQPVTAFSVTRHNHGLLLDVHNTALAILAPQLEAASGIRLIWPQRLADDTLSGHIEGSNWPALLRALFVNYSTATAQDTAGQVNTFYVFTHSPAPAPAPAARATGKPAEIQEPTAFLPAIESMNMQPEVGPWLYPQYEGATTADRATDFMNAAPGSHSYDISPAAGAAINAAGELDMPATGPSTNAAETRELLLKMRSAADTIAPINQHSAAGAADTPPSRLSPAP
jgi:hypothetical protein